MSKYIDSVTGINEKLALKKVRFCDLVSLVNYVHLYEAVFKNILINIPFWSATIINISDKFHRLKC